MALTVETVAHADALAERAVAWIDAYGAECIAARGRFTVSLAGGSTPKALYRLWGARSALDWTQVGLFYGDERCVPPDHADSNHGMVVQTLLGQLATRPAVFRMAGEESDPHQAARDYQTTLLKELGPDGRLDLALLGLGPDGHTASLFPHGESLREQERWCVAAPAPDGKMWRLTLTYPALRRAGRILFLAAGGEKSAILKTMLRGPMAAKDYPSQPLLRDESLPVTLLADEAALAETDAA